MRIGRRYPVSCPVVFILVLQCVWSLTGCPVVTPPVQVAVPDVVGAAYLSAQYTISGAGLLAGAITGEFSDTVAAGAVIRQDPAAGTVVDQGTTVALAVSYGADKRPVPNVAGKLQVAAQSAIADAGLSVGTITEQFSLTVAVGLVISQNPAAGVQASTGTAVHLVISKGPQPVSVPSLVGLTTARAQAAIRNAGLVVGTLTQQFSNTVLAGTVLAQSVPAGTVVDAGTTINLVASKGPQPVAVPHLVGLTGAMAQSALTGAGLAVGNVTFEYSNAVAAGVVISQSVAAGTLVPFGSSVNVVVSKGVPPVAVPDLVELTLVNAETAIIEASLVLGTVTYEYSNTIPSGSVIGQDPAAGAGVVPGTKVNLVVSKGTQVPSLVGLTSADARVSITAAGLVVGSLSQSYSETVPLGTVISQSPLAGADALLGSVVNLVVSKGRQPVAVPNVTGVTAANAQAKIVAAGFVVGTITQQYDSSVPSGSVVSQVPAFGASAVPGTGINLVISKGVRPVVVPEILNKTVSAADTLLKNAQLKAGNSSQEYNNTYAKGLICGQSPAAGTEVAPWTGIDYVVSKGPLMKVPNVVGMTDAQATAALKNAGLAKGTITQRYDFTIPEGQVMGQSVAPDTMLPPDTLIDLILSKGKQPVPNVVGEPSEVAKAAILGANFVVGTITRQFDDTIAEGSVVSQNPGAGAIVAPGTAIALVLSKGPQPVVVPNVVGLPRASAETAITNARLIVAPITEEYSNVVAAGLIIRQTPAGGSSALPGTRVDLVVSKGPQPVPDLKGMTSTAAQAAITAAGFKVGTITEQYSSDTAAGRVMQQTPPAGTIVAQGSSVNIVLSKGHAPVTVPDIVNMTESAAEGAIVDAGLTLGTVTIDYSATVPDGSVISQSPDADTLAAYASPVDIVVSGLPMMPVPAGTFVMGNSNTGNDSDYASGHGENPSHDVALSPYVIGKYEVTNGQYCQGLNWAYKNGLLFRNTAGASWTAGFDLYAGEGVARQKILAITSSQCDIQFTGGAFVPKSRVGTPGGATYSMAGHPVHHVTWYGAIAFCNWWSLMHDLVPAYDMSVVNWPLTALPPFAAGYRLPTEAEWERAAAWDASHSRHWVYGISSHTLAGANRANYYNGLASVDPFGLTLDPKTSPVGWFNGVNESPNGLVATMDSASPAGCYDMSGNVLEWCYDWYSLYTASAQTNPIGSGSGVYRVARGGSWNKDVVYARTACRGDYAVPTYTSNDLGFRIARSQSSTTDAE